MSQTPRLRRARQLTASFLPTRPTDGYVDLVTGRLQKIAAAGSSGVLPFTGAGEGAIYFEHGKVVYAESERTPPAAVGAYPAQVDKLPPLERIMAARAATEPTLDAVLELFTAEVRYTKFRPSRRPAAGLAPGIAVDALLAEITRRERLMKQLAAVITPDTAISRNPHIRTDSIRILAWQWALLIRVGHGSSPRNLAWELGRSVFGATIDVYKLLVMRLLSTAGDVPERGLTAMSFVRAASIQKGSPMPVISAGSAAEGGV
jgi:hypothetical protein